MELNRVEQRALLLGAGLVVLGTAARLGLVPGSASFAWRPAGEPGGAAGLEALRAEVDAAVDRAERASRPLDPGETLDPNQAPAEELERLPGIGPQKALAIVEERSAHGPFRSTDDLTRVPGLGPVLLRRLTPYVSLPQRDMSASALATPEAAGGAPAPVSDLDLNHAAAEELERLPGIGPLRARAIVEERARAGPFRSVDELARIRGIGPALVEGIRPYVTIR